MINYNLNTKDLTLLADYLSKLPEGYEKFEMAAFITGEDLMPCEVLPNHCGTAGCAIGHAPLVEGITKPEYEESWSSYSERVAFTDVDIHDGLMDLTRSQERLWDFMFGSEWADVDNTPHGAAKRIKMVLEDPDTCIKFCNNTSELLILDVINYNKFMATFKEIL